ncbi:MAG: PAS domain S-box-containing protein [Bacteroidia bacterium]|jgi:PAS domain S-box-containing protein
MKTHIDKDPHYFRSLIELSLDPMVVISGKGLIIDMNEVLCKVTGYTRDHLLNTKFSNYFTDQPTAEEVYHRVFLKGFLYDYPLTLKSKKGGLTDVLYNASVYKDDEGSVIGVTAVARQVAEQKLYTELGNAEEKLAFQKDEKEKRTAELVIANEELLFENQEKEKRASELVEADLELDFQNKEKEKRARELGIANKELVDQNKEKIKQEIVNKELEALSFSEKSVAQYSRSLIEASLDPLVTISAEGKILDVNEASITVTGVKREKLIDTNFSSYFTEPEKAKKGLEQVFEKGFVADYPLTIKGVNGKLTDVLYNASVYKDDKGEVLGVFAAARDVTAQKLLSKYSLSLIEASLDPLVTISIEGKITDMNQATVKITGLARKKLKGTDFFDYFTQPQKAREVYQQVFAKGSVADSPLTVRHIGGKLTDVLFNGSVYTDDKDNVLGAVIVARDVTDQKKIAKELLEAKIAAESATKIAENAQIKAENATLIAENAVRAKQQFLSNMSHEIRTPMNAIIGFTKVVLKTDLTAKQKEYLTAIKMSGDTLIVLINDILDLAKVDAGKMVFEQTPFKLRSSISVMLHLFEIKIHERNLTLVKEYDDRIPEVLLGDSVRLHQIIMNLVSNAVKFTTEGSITVSVLLLSEDDEKVTIQFDVKDSGIGIKKDKLKNIFDDFQQATSGTSRLYGGTGLGLAIVKQLVEPQGGTIAVTSTQGIGSTFSVVLPFLKTDEDPISEAEAFELDAHPKHIKVLVVEDIPFNQLLMKTLLDDFGFERDIAENGKIAVEKLRTQEYDIILMDLQMPIMNGFAATEYIRNTMHSSIPIIALTADVTKADLDKCKAVGMDGHIAKPVDERLLYTKIMNLVKKPEKRLSSDNEGMNSGESCIDLEYLNKRTKSNPKLMMEMITLYLEQTPPLIKAMKNSFKNEDWETLHSAVHKIIPSFSIMGIDLDYENKARVIQEYANTQQQSGEIPELVLQLDNVCTQACKELEQELNKLELLANEN